MKVYTRLILILIFLGFAAAPVQASGEDPRIGEAVIQEPPDEAPQRDFTGCTRIDVAAVNDAYEQQVVELVNQERWNNGKLPPLKRNTLLDLAARYHAKDMRDDNYFQHDTYDGYGGTQFVCSWSTRIKNWYASGGENIAWGYSTPAAVMSGWMGSSGHKANILSTGYREIGVGYFTGSLWVQDFATKSGVYPLVINREAAQTDSYQVSLYLYGQGTISQVRFRNDSDAWGSWMPFSANLTWNLNQVKGVRSVTAELKTSTGTVYTSSDDIYLNNGAALGGLPDTMVFVYDQSQGMMFPNAYTLQPQNIGGTTVLTWTIQTSHGWISASSGGGPTPNSQTQVSVAGVDTSTPGIVSGSVTITVTNPVGTANSPKSIPVLVSVVPNLNNKIYMALVSR